MGKILENYLMPHPPIAVPEIGGSDIKNCKDTIEGMNNIAEKIKQLQPDTIVVITPHGPVFRDAICVSTDEELYGNFENFNHPEINMEFENDKIVVANIIDEVKKQDIYVGEVDESFAGNYGVSTKIDHGCLVPLYFINKKYKDYKFVHITMGMLPNVELYKVGMAIRKGIERSNVNAIVIASGDLSHKLLRNAPAGYDKMGSIFDRKIVDSLRDKPEELLYFDRELVNRAGECGYRPLIILLGTMDGYEIKSEVLSYEGPFGVGYANAVLTPLRENKEFKRLDNLINNKYKKAEKLKGNEDKYVNLARTTLETYVKENKIIKLPPNLPDEMLENKAGTFVSIKKDGELRGCIGTTEPTQENIALEIIQNAISAGTNDPRFPPVHPDELDDLTYSVDVLKEPEDIDSIDELDVKKYGVIVQKDYRKGLLLPNLEGIDTVGNQVAVALKKAGINPAENYSMQRFEVERHH